MFRKYVWRVIHQAGAHSTKLRCPKCLPYNFLLVTAVVGSRVVRARMRATDRGSRAAEWAGGRERRRGPENKETTKQREPGSIKKKMCHLNKLRRVIDFDFVNCEGLTRTADRQVRGRVSRVRNTFFRSVIIIITEKSKIISIALIFI